MTHDRTPGAGDPDGLPPPPAQLRRDELSSADLDALYGLVAARIEAERGPFAALQREPFAARVAVGALVGVLPFVAMLVAAPRPDLASLPWPRFAADVALLVGTVVVVAAVSQWPLHRPALPRALVFALEAAGLAVVLALALLPPAPAPPGASPALLRGAFGCFPRGLLAGLPAYLLLQRLGRGADHEGWAAAVVAGLVANLTLHAGCPGNAADHLLLGHVAVSVAFVAGHGLRERAQRWRARRAASA